MKAWFLNLSLRERQVVFFGGLLLGIFLIYEMIFASLSSGVSHLRDKVRSDTSLLTWMTETNQRIQSLENSASPSSEPLTGSLLSSLQTTLNHSPFSKSVTQLQQSENDSVEVKLQNIPFDEFAKWLIDFTQQNELRILQLTTTPNKDPGMVNVDLKLV